MPLFLDTRGRSTLGIGICGRCSRKMSLEDLYPDPNYPGLRVCRDDLDQFDPWRLPPPPPDQITLLNPRPDTHLYPFDPIPVYADQIEGITQIQVTNPWRPSRVYRKGSTVTPLNANDPSIDGPQYEFMALNNGVSGQAFPTWPSNAGVQFAEGTVTWLCLGLYLLDGNQQPVAGLSNIPVPPVAPTLITGLSNDGGVLVLDDPAAWPAVPVLLGGLWSNGGVCSLAPGAIFNPLVPPIQFGTITAGQLLFLGGAAIQQTQANQGYLWCPGGIDGGDILVA